MRRNKNKYLPKFRLHSDDTLNISDMLKVIDKVEKEIERQRIIKLIPISFIIALLIVYFLMKLGG